MRRFIEARPCGGTDDRPSGTAQLLDDWDSLPLDRLLRLARETVENPEMPTVAGGANRAGGWSATSGVFPEIAHAAGLLPIKVRGAQVEARQADARFGSCLCSIVKIARAALSERLRLDLFVSHPICVPPATSRRCGV